MIAPSSLANANSSAGVSLEDRELTDDEMAADDETTYWLLDRGWSNDEAAFCGGEH